MGNGGARPGEKYYSRAGLAYGKRTGKMYSYIKPANQVFSQEGQAIFPLEKVSIWAALALSNSSIYADLFATAFLSTCIIAKASADAQSDESLDLSWEGLEILTICDHLREKGRILPAYYSKALHYLGVVHFRLGNHEVAEKFFDRSILVRQEIDRSPYQYEDPDPLDRIIFRRQGPGWVLFS